MNEVYHVTIIINTPYQANLIAKDLVNKKVAYLSKTDEQKIYKADEAATDKWIVDLYAKDPAAVSNIIEDHIGVSIDEFPIMTWTKEETTAYFYSKVSECCVTADDM